MSRLRHSTRPVHEDEDKPDERWMASYMDMVTVLMCLFIVLYAMSTVDQKKFEQLSESLTTGFGGTISVEGREPLDTQAEPASDQEVAQAEVNALLALRDQAQAALGAAGLGQAAQFRLDSRGLTIQLVGSETYFGGNSIDLTTNAERVLDAIGPTLAGSSRQISVEGHADAHGQSGAFATDWELSSGRATQVLRHLVERGGVAGDHIGATGYGSARPSTAGATAQEVALNRRVDVVVQSSQSESVTALMEQLLAAG